MNLQEAIEAASTGKSVCYSTNGGRKRWLNFELAAGRPHNSPSVSARAYGTVIAIFTSEGCHINAAGYEHSITTREAINYCLSRPGFLHSVKNQIMAGNEPYRPGMLISYPGLHCGRWVIDTGLPGYGPDASNDSYSIATDWESLADEIARVLNEIADSEADSAEAFAGQEDYREAWHVHKKAESMTHLAMCFSNSRKTAPLYLGNPRAWHETIRHLVAENFAYDVNSSLRIYVWPDDNYAADEDEDS